jgi:hypothetical protein
MSYVFTCRAQRQE